MLGVHDLGDDGQARGRLGLQQQPDALLVEALEGVGGGAGLEGPAPEDMRAAGLDGLGHGDDLLLRLHRAGAGHHQEVAAADFGPVGEGDDSVLLVELPVGVLVGLLDALDGLHNVQGQDALHVHPGGVPHQADDGVVLAHGHMGFQTHVVQPGVEQLHLLALRALFQNDNHGTTLLFTDFFLQKKKVLQCRFTVRPEMDVLSSTFSPQQNKPYLLV